MNSQNTTYDLPDEMTNQLLCFHCNVYVSCSPVKTLPDGTLLCGRCSPTKSDKYARNVLIETTMSKFTFPCRYKLQGCNKRVLFDKAIEHEDVCSYRTFLCPAWPYGSCLKNVSMCNIYKHFEENHVDLIMKTGKFKLDFQQNYECNLLMVIDGVIVIVFCSYDAVKNVMHLDIKHLSHDNQEKIFYKLQIISGSDKERALHFKKSLCYRYGSPMVKEENTASLSMGTFLPALGNPMYVFVNITLKTEQTLTKGKQTLILQKQSDNERHTIITRRAWDALEKVRCTLCNYFTTSPVYEGTKICQGYYQPLGPNKIKACVYCKEQPTARDYDFTEKHYEELNYPCSWRDCTFMGNKYTIKQHEEQCWFKTYFCPVFKLCLTGYFTASNLMEHMLKHGTFCRDPTNIVIQLFTENPHPVQNVYFTLFEKEVIAFVCEITNYSVWKLEGNFRGFSVNIFFEHDHCRIKTKTCFYANQIDLKSDNEKVLKHFPNCFKFCKRIEAVITVKKI